MVSITRLWFAGLLAGVVALAITSPAAALDVPPLRGRVTDTAGLLDPAKAGALESELARYEQETGHQLALLTVPSLEGEPIESFAVRAFESWKLGDAERDDGLLMVVSSGDRRVRIEVGYGLEGAIPDAIAARVIREAIVPAFRAGDYAGGIDRAFDLLMAAGQGEALGPATNPPPRSERRGVGFGPTALFWILLLVFSAFGRRGRRRGYMVGAPGGFFIGGGGGGGFGGGGGGGGFGGGGGGSGGGGASGSW
jgi:uncharacterized protein